VLQGENMRTLFFFLLFVVSGQNHFPRFEDYSVKTKYKSKPAKVDLKSHPRAKMFRSVLRNAASRGPNFAGHYAIAQWGCGTSCIEFAVIDLKTGKVFINPEPATSDLVFDIDSRLLVVNPIDSSTYKLSEHLPDYLMTRYLIWEGSSFKQIDSSMKPVEFQYKPRWER
jgi:hypothetical protein